MAPRASWKGYLKLSLVSCPVRLYPATSSSERIAFNQLHKDTHNRINMKPVDPELGLVERTDLVKGYEYEDKKYIIIDEADLDSVRIESNHTMNIEAFVEEGSVDVIYQDAPYYLAPDGAMAEETFAVLREALHKTGKLAIARLVLSSRERVVTIGSRENGMFVCTLRNPSEVRGTAEYFGNIPAGDPDPEMLQLAEALIQQKLTTFDPKNYEDRYEIARIVG
ncbi:MAG: Ku protein, partial [Proteobacteria bacterium]|nr:Ku protein [Pseudomonadota bacterium]